MAGVGPGRLSPRPCHCRSGGRPGRSVCLGVLLRRRPNCRRRAANLRIMVNAHPARLYRSAVVCAYAAGWAYGQDCRMLPRRLCRPHPLPNCASVSLLRGVAGLGLGNRNSTRVALWPCGRFSHDPGVLRRFVFWPGPPGPLQARCLGPRSLRVRRGPRRRAVVTAQSSVYRWCRCAARAGEGGGGGGRGLGRCAV